MKRALLLLSPLACLFSCQQVSPPEDMLQAGDRLERETRNKQVARTFEEFTASPRYAFSRDIWCGRALELTDPQHSRVEILLSVQRGRLYIRDKIAMDFPICSGRVGGSETPTGSFRISEKKLEHRSSLYGSFVDANDRVVKGGADSRRHKAPAGAHFKGALMPYWMRFNGAVGLHVGTVLRDGDSHGCVRVPPEACSILYSKLAVGSAVIVK